VPVPGRLERWSSVVGIRDARTALISAIVTATVGVFTNAFESGTAASSEPGPDKRSEPSHALWWSLAAAVAIALVGLVLLWRHRRPQLFRSTLAIAIGCSVGLLALYLLD
jgi:hypothetical protein